MPIQRQIMKPLFLVLILSGCLLTLLTSHSSELGTIDIPILKPAKDFCNAIRVLWNTCESESKQQGCDEQLKKLHLCDLAIHEAYRNINFGGCSKASLANSLCHREWCTAPASRRGCAVECDQVQQSLNECILGHVDTYKRRYRVSQ
jgi:hypothetical protein